jgi:hypothetical protein
MNDVDDAQYKIKTASQVIMMNRMIIKAQRTHTHFLYFDWRIV